MNKRSLIAISSLLTLTLIFIYFSQPIAAFLVRPFFKVSQTEKKVALGYIQTTSPAVYVRRLHTTKFIHASDLTPLYHGDLIKVEKEGDAVLNFNVGDQVRVYENSLLRLELFRAGKNKIYPLLLTVLQGQPTLLQKSKVENSIFISKDNQWLSNNAPAPQRVVQPSSNATSLVRPSTANTLIMNPPAILAESKIKDLIPTPKSKKNGGITTAYIESVIESKAEVLRRCQLNSLRDDKNIVGSMILSITIAPSGRVQNVHVSQSQLDNDQLTNCTVAALKRLQFSKFVGEPVTVAYPIEYR